MFGRAEFVFLIFFKYFLIRPIYMYIYLYILYYYYYYYFLLLLFLVLFNYFLVLHNSFYTVITGKHCKTVIFLYVLPCIIHLKIKICLRE